jgi:putative transposase
MGKQTTTGNQASRIVWDNLEEWVRRKVQEFIQSLMEEEIAELLGRQKSERRKAVDGSPAYRNGYGKERKLTLGCGTITLRRPRLRGLIERFESRVLPLFARRTKGVSKLIPRLYLHGLALGDFDLALRGLLGENAPVSASTVARLKEGWQAEWREWKRRSLEGLQVVYLWVDGVYVKAGLEKQKAALMVIIGGLLDGRKVVLAVEPGYRESTESWSEVLRDLKERGMNCPCLVVGDGNLGIWGALANVYPDALEQRCWNHKMVNVVESPFAGLRLRTNAAKRYKKVENATAVIWKMLLLAELRFHRLDAPEKLMQAYLEFSLQEGNEETETNREEVLAIA